MLVTEKNGISKSTWKVLAMDKFTVKIMSSVCKMSEITQEGISLVEVITKHRQPITAMEVIYFIQPNQNMSGKSPLYKNSPVSRSIVTLIRKDLRAIKRIGALKEVASFCPFHNFVPFGFTKMT